MAKYLQKPCVDIRIKTMQIARKQSEEGGNWQTYAVFLGEAIDEDGNVLESIHKKTNVGPPGPADWDADSFEADLLIVTNTVKKKYGQVLAEYTV
jgi:hypothetical protein